MQPHEDDNVVEISSHLGADLDLRREFGQMGKILDGQRLLHFRSWIRTSDENRTDCGLSFLAAYGGVCTTDEVDAPSSDASVFSCRSSRFGSPSSS